jgi:glycosyltransferase involved in cell wall biosynthesis
MDVSVLISVYNGEKHIASAIESILNQTFINFELIIIDDGSNDSTKNIINSFKDSRIKYFYQKNSGISVALNYGLSVSRGKYIAKLDADDISYPSRLSTQFNYMENNPNCVVCGSYADVIDNEGTYIYTFKVPVLNNDIQKNMIHYNCIIHSASFYRRDIAMKIGGYYEPIRQHFEDYMFLSALIKNGNAYNFDIPLVRYRINVNSVSTRDFSFRYNKLVRDVIQRGYITDLEKDYLFKYKSKVANIKLKYSNYNLLLSRLYFLYQKDYPKTKLYLYKAVKTYPFNLNIIFTLFWIFKYKILNFFYASDNL